MTNTLIPRELTPEELVQVRKIELEILDKISSVSEVLGIQFFLDSGTLLGAARHTGYIPWDDDIDIGMTRNDFEIFKNCGQDVLGKDYFLQSESTDPTSSLTYIKVRKNGTHIIEFDNAGLPHNDGIWVDVFPYDPAQELLIEQRNTLRHCRLYSKLLNWRVIPHASYVSSRSRKIIRKLIHVVLSILPASWYRKKMENISVNLCDDGYDSLVCAQYCTGELVVLSEKDVFPLGSLEFEGKMYPVFSNWTVYLEQYYGNWKEMPPVEQRKGHEIVRIAF